MIRKIRKIHRLLGLFVGLQILLWGVGGLYFSWNEIGKVRGENLVAKQKKLFLQDSDFISPSKQISQFTREYPEVELVDQLVLRSFMGLPVYEIRYQEDGKIRHALSDPHTGRIRPPISEDEAIAIAKADFAPEAPILKVDYIEEIADGSEYRGRPLPAWRIEFDHPSHTRIYISAERGLVTARRNNTWRWFDFLWMLHIMDYEDRDNFNNLLLQGMSVLGLVTVASGFVLWGTTTRLFRRQADRRNVIDSI
ncbi:MAG: PepSY domain-containing protein [Nitrospiria bacterium]